MMERAYILFAGMTGGEFAFGCVTGQLRCREIGPLVMILPRWHPAPD